MLQEILQGPVAKTSCKLCGKALRGRIDKRFCDDYCRNSFNNQLKGPTNNLVRNINNALGKNRRILEKLLKSETEAMKMPREKLVAAGFLFKYYTHTYTTRTGKTYYFCYDMGYLPLDNEWVVLVRKKEEAL